MSKQTPTDRPRLYLIRHCRTRWNDDHRVQGSNDIPLSNEGRAQARELAPALERLGIQRIISSPLARALETARIYGAHLGVPVETDPRLVEIDHGDWEGQRSPTLSPALKEAWDAWHSDPLQNHIPGGSETIVEAQARVVGAVREALARHPDQVLLIVTHMHIRATLLCALRGLGLEQFAAQTDRGAAPIAVPDEQIGRIMRGAGR
ncbi:MAG: histidine phosphatase family protein [Anaerolineae bacterium]|nr:histidine phosphatase family protein [Anaerolineae bacterium]